MPSGATTYCSGTRASRTPTLDHTASHQEPRQNTQDDDETKRQFKMVKPFYSSIQVRNRYMQHSQTIPEVVYTTHISLSPKRGALKTIGPILSWAL